MPSSGRTLADPPALLLLLALLCAPLQAQQDAHPLAAPPTAPLAPNTLPADTRLEIRLQQQITSYSTSAGIQVHAVLIAPVRAPASPDGQPGRILIPMGSFVGGKLVRVRRVGLGMLHETALLDFNFDEIDLPDGTHVPLQSRIHEVENSRESVDKEGRVKGISSTSTIAYRASGVISTLALSNPIGLVFTTSSSAAVLRFSDPEILLPPGTELILHSTAPLTVPDTAAPTPDLAPVAPTPEAREKLLNVVRTLPFVTTVQPSQKAAHEKSATESAPAKPPAEKTSDLTNLVFIGSQESIQHAFAAAGWVQSDNLTAETTYRTVRSITEQQQYNSAPMSNLMLAGHLPDFTYSKTLNTFSKRHHIRIWQDAQTWSTPTESGLTVWTASSTQDIGIGFSKKDRTFIHLIDTNIDNERAKVVNDLIFTGCVDAVQLVQRPWLPKDAKNGTGEELHTDGAIAVLQLNSCGSPQPSDIAVEAPTPVRGNMAQRATRQTVLTLKNNLYQQNVIYMTYGGIRYLVNRKKKDPNQPDDRQMDVDGTRYTIESAAYAGSAVGASLGTSFNGASLAPRVADRWAPPSVEIGVHGGNFHYSTDAFNAVLIDVNTTNSGLLQFGFISELKGGWNTGVSVTLNPYQHFSNEFNFDYNRGNFRLTGYGVNQDNTYFHVTEDGLATAEFSYSLLYNFTRKSNRFRPYLALGPALQMIHIADAPFKKAPAYFGFGLKNVGIIAAAYEYGSTPPLEGGGIFQPAIQYGAGFRYRIAPRWAFTTAFRETFSAQPNFWAKSLPHIQNLLDFDDPGWTASADFPTVKSGPLFANRASGGIAFTF
jgi:hypothetical protein